MDFLTFINDRTMNLVYVATQLTMTLVFLIIYPIYRKDYLKILAFGHVVASVGLLLLSLQQFIPTIFSVFIANLGIVGGHYITFAGVMVMVEQKVPKKTMMALFGGYTIAQFSFIYFYPNTAYRVALYCTIIIIGVALLSLAFIRHLRKSWQLFPLVLMGLYLGEALLSGWRMVNALSAESGMEALFRDAPILKIYFAYLIVSTILRTITILLQNSEGLMVD